MRGCQTHHCETQGNCDVMEDSVLLHFGFVERQLAQGCFERKTTPKMTTICLIMATHGVQCQGTWHIPGEGPAAVHKEAVGCKHQGL